MICPTCKTTRWMEFECIACCVRWLETMTPEAMRLNAPVIELVCGSEHMPKVREAWRSFAAQRSST